MAGEACQPHPKTTCPASDETSGTLRSLKKCMVTSSTSLNLSSAPSLQGLTLIRPSGEFMISLGSGCLLVALGNQQQLSLPVTGKEAGGDRNRTGTHSLSHSLGSSMVCLSESQAPPDPICYRDTSPDASPLELRGNGTRL